MRGYIHCIGFFIHLIVFSGCGAPSSPQARPQLSGGERRIEGEAAGEWELKPYEDPWLGLLSVPASPLSASLPEEPSPPAVAEHPPTYGTCVGTPSTALKQKRGQYICCYTPPSYFQQRIRKKWSDIKACYSAALARDAKTQGRIVSKFTIEEDGSVKQACDNGSTVGDPVLVECVLKVMTTVEFDAYSIGDPCPAVTLMYPIQFSPEPESVQN